MIIAMTEEYACLIFEWKYEGAYSFYDPNEEKLEAPNEEYINDLMDGTSFASINSDGELIGYYTFGKGARIQTVEENVYDDDYLDIGLGLRPDLCGKGYGVSYFMAGLDFAKKMFDTKQFRLSVAAFNERAIKVYKKAGFCIKLEVTHLQYNNKFLIMKCEKGGVLT